MRYSFLLLLFILFSCSSNYYLKNNSSEQESIFIDGDEYFVSSKPNSIVYISDIESDGKFMYFYMSVANFNDRNVTFNPVGHIRLNTLYKNDQIKSNRPMKPKDYVDLVKSRNAWIAVVGAASNGYVNSLSGYKSESYSSNQSFIVNGDYYNVTSFGTYTYYDQSEVDRRNRETNIRLQRQFNNINFRSLELDDRMLKTNTLKPGGQIFGLVAVKDISKKKKNTEVKIQVRDEIHQFIFNNIK
ncbi:MAG: hypothetical protein VYB44_07145 [Bacteroidota bacterium]|nr:hypothetical protein [Bacteroidota bacterium]